MTSELPDFNPKTRVAASKAPLNLVPPSSTFYLSKAFADGAKKYGPYNWRSEPVSASVYYAALLRHMQAWWDGEDVAQDSKIEHLAHAMACIAILLDADSVGSLQDDRPTSGAMPLLLHTYVPNKENKL